MIKGLLYRLVIPPLRLVNRAVRKLAAATHLAQFKLEGGLRPDAEWFDHQLDVYWQWPVRRRSSFLERGVLNSLRIAPGARVLELCSGDGFFARNFYGPRAAEVVAVDGNAEAVAYARRRNSAPNVEYVLGDIQARLPAGPFHNVIWDSAITHFSAEEMRRVLEAVDQAMAPDGVLSGQTDYEEGSEYRFLRQTFPTKESLADALAGTFPHVAVYEIREPGRANYYFFCGRQADALPFADGDPQIVRRGPAA